MEPDRREHRAVLSDGGDMQMEIFGYRTHRVRFAACVLGYLLTCGFLLLLFYWKPEWNVWANCVPCSLRDADVILLRAMDDFKKYFRKKVRWINLSSERDPLKRSADHRLIADEDCAMNKAIMQPALKVRFIQVQKIKYAWINSEEKFVKIGELEDSFSSADIHSRYGAGLTSEEQDTRKLICGPNTIEIEVVPIWKLFVKEVLNLFYIHQFFTLILWLSEGYYEFAPLILFISIVAICLTLYELRQQSVRLHNLVEGHNNVSITVCRNNGEHQVMESRHLVPGDVIAVSGRKLYMPCDAVLISGSCVVNEGMLTGESIPVTKTHLPSDGNSMPWKSQSGEDYKRHVLFCGTEVILAKPAGREPVKAVVLRTGFNTAKGDLVRSILYPRPLNFKLHRDAIKFFLFIGCIGVVGTVYSVTIAAMNKSPVNRIIIDAIVVLTAAFSPAIQAALAIGIIIAQRRLKNKGIFCISPQRINISGQVNIICFDKTGTLTEDGMDVWGLVPTQDNCFQKVRKFSPDEVFTWGPLLGAMASCHSLIVLDGELQGDPLEQKMFYATGWVIEDSGTKNEDEHEGVTESSMLIKPGPDLASTVPVSEIVIVHQYPFSSSLQRMSVITQVIGQSAFDIYMKGAPEKVASFCRQETVPSNFSEELEFYTCQGFRVIGLAFKTLPVTDVETLTREDVESDLEFLGLLILENKLKKETKDVLQELSKASIRTVMITGDNLQTAVTVAKQSAMVSSSSRIIHVEASAPSGQSAAAITWREMEENPQDANGNDIKLDVEGRAPVPSDCRDYHFAMDGRSYQVLLQHRHSLLQKVLMNGTIFARMAPAQKSSLIEEFQKMSYFVAMCGDGANDCGALKMAHAGISLSEQEASVASPFTSKTDNIQCVAELLKQGRAALVTSFCLFKYVVLYGLILYTAILILYWRGGYFGKYQFLIQDLAITMVFMTMSLNAAYPKLAPFRPPGHLFSPPVFLSVVLNIIFNLCVLIYGYFVVQKQSWYNATNINSACVTSNETGDVLDPFSQTISNAFRTHQTYENTTLWLLSTGNLLIVAFVFSKGRPFRKPVYTNYPLFIVLLAFTGLCFFFIFADIHPFYKVMELVCTPTLWRVHIVIILIVNFAVTFTVEEAILGNRALWNWLKARFSLQPLSLYKSLRPVLAVDPNWPPTNKPFDPLTISTPTEDGIEMYCNPVALAPEPMLSGGYEQRKPSGEHYINLHVH